jgi:glycosyltransferase involved in cell wall biosynthesis
MSKILDIIYFGDTKDINGVNLVNNLLLKGKNEFKKNNIYLRTIFSPNETIDCQTNESLEVGINIGTKKYKFNRIIRTILRITMDSRIPIFAWYKFKKNFLIPSQKVINQNYDKFNSDYILFQDIFTAYYYYKKSSEKRPKTILVLHCEKDIFAQFKLNFPGIFNSRYKKQIEEIFYFTLNKVGKVVFVSKKSSAYNKLLLKNNDFVHNGIEDLPNFNFKSSNNNTINFVCVGTINYNKGQEIIIEAFNLLPKKLKEKCNVYIVGDGPQASELKKTVTRYNLDKIIQFLGLRKDVSEILNNMDVLLLLSKTEGLPLSIIEGLRQGLYIIATDVGGISEMIDDGFGKLIERNPKKLAEEIKKILEEDLLNENSKKLSRDFFLNNFTLEKMITKYSLLFKSMESDED